MIKPVFLSTLLASTAFMLTACGGESPAQKAETPRPLSSVEKSEPTPSVEPTKTASISGAMTEDALLKRGRIVWFKCRSCHETSVDGPHKVGPNLYAMMGAEAGVKEGFVYSEALKESGIVWDEESLDAFIEKPANYVRGTKMAFVGIRKESDRQAVIAYIKENTKPSE